MPRTERIDWINMPNLYFCDAGNHIRGLLRAVLSWEDCTRVLRDSLTTHLGEEDFPVGPAQFKKPAAAPFLHVLPEEASEQWRAGFYLVHASFAEIDERLRNLTR